jgi:PPK2 family polyphosphate:nucleotide phosphotransferase
MKISKLADRYRVENGRKFRLRSCDPSDTAGIRSAEKAKEALAEGVRRMADLQEKLYAQDRWSLLLVFQAMDAAGKDGAIDHVMSGVDPQGCQVFAFKSPSAEELDHDFLWRSTKCLPERGRIGIFNRSYYEEVLVVRVHPEILAGQRIPSPLVGKRIWQERFESIRDFEKHVSRNGTIVRKFFLNVSKKEQKRRFLDRLAEPEKNWKFALRDVLERGHWDAYMEAYEEAIRETATADSPWFVLPADNKWFTRLAVASVVVDTLESLDLRLPEPDAARRKELDEARKLLGVK